MKNQFLVNLSRKRYAGLSLDMHIICIDIYIYVKVGCVTVHEKQELFVCIILSKFF